ncbi:hypothetical protein [Solirubrobacter soli]|uniref:hypothetical protein n=1 Tax=Solirubrobacter soli TaxID=363832 RepID=UPI000481F2D9|nr:hypothetical protein [Solirubrobacter soli]
MINSVSSRPGLPGHVQSRPSRTPVQDNASFDEAAARTAKARRAKVADDDDAVQAGIQLSRAYELASKRQPFSKSVPRDLLWALTGPGGAAEDGA